MKGRGEAAVTHRSEWISCWIADLDQDVQEFLLITQGRPEALVNLRRHGLASCGTGSVRQTRMEEHIPHRHSGVVGDSSGVLLVENAVMVDVTFDNDRIHRA